MHRSSFRVGFRCQNSPTDAERNWRRGERLEYWIALAVRGGIGVILGILFGFGALMITLTVVPGHYMPPLMLLVSTTALGASVLGLLTFYKPDLPWRVTARRFALAPAGGFTGGWIKHWRPQTFRPDEIRNVTLAARPVNTPATTPFIASAAERET